MREMASLGLDAVHDTLEVAVDVLEFAPVVGLAEAARVLLTIWDAVQLVEVGLLSVYLSRPYKLTDALIY